MTLNLQSKPVAVSEITHYVFKGTATLSFLFGGDISSERHQAVQSPGY